MSSLEADQAHREFDLTEAAHRAVLEEASQGRPWTPEALSNPGVEIERDVYVEGILEADPREKHDRHDLLIDGRLERYLSNVEEGRQKWDVVLTERDFYEHPDALDVNEDISHERDPERHLKKGDGDLIFLDLDRYEAHMVEVKPHEGYADSGKSDNSSSAEVERWQEEEFTGRPYDSGIRDDDEIYDFVSRNYPEASREDVDVLLGEVEQGLETAFIGLAKDMQDASWAQVSSEFLALAEAGELPESYLEGSETSGGHDYRGEEGKQNSGDSSTVVKKKRNWREAWQSVIGELENDWDVYQPEFVFGSEVLDESSLSNNAEYALPTSYSQEPGYALGTDEGFSKAASSEDMDTLNNLFFRGGIDELVDGDRPEMQGREVI
jgi:hypothetical protein